MKIYNTFSCFPEVFQPETAIFPLNTVQHCQKQLISTLACYASGATGFISTVIRFSYYSINTLSDLGRVVFIQ